MAFENVFQGIDFQAPTRAAQTSQQQFLNILGNSITRSQQQAEFDKRMELEMAKAQNKPFDLQQQAQQDAYNILISRGVPQEQAAIETYQQFQNPRLDPTTGAIIQPADIMGNLGLGRQAPPAPMGMPQDLPQSILQEAPAPFTRAMPQQLPIEADMPVFPDMEAQAMGQPSIPSKPTIEIPAGLSPRTNQAAQEEVVKKTLEEQFAERKELAERAKGRPAQERKLMSQAMKFKNVNNIVNDAMGMVDSFSAGVGSKLSAIPATSAKDLQAKLMTIGADAAFGALQEMRDNSKTGGALGNVALGELDLLKAALTSLDQEQSPAELKKSLRNYQQVRLGSLQRVADAYEQDYGERPESLDSLINEMTPEMPKQDEIQEELRRRGLIQ
jgi:hypothetical protein